MKKAKQWLTWLSIFLAEFIDDHMPALCSSCGAVVFSKDTETLTHRVAGSVTVCKNCYGKIMGPLGTEL